MSCDQLQVETWLVSKENITIENCFRTRTLVRRVKLIIEPTVQELHDTQNEKSIVVQNRVAIFAALV